MTRQIHRLPFLPLGLLTLLGGCAMYGDDVASYGRYNGSIGVGVGAGYGYGYGYGPGWYDGFYYPGSGLWAYDRGGKRHRWQGGDHRRDGDGRGGDPRGGHRPDRPGPTGTGAGPGVGNGGPDGRPRPDWRGRGDVAGQPARRQETTPRPARAAQPERAPARPGREGRNRAERPD